MTEPQTGAGRALLQRELGDEGYRVSVDDGRPYDPSVFAGHVADVLAIEAEARTQLRAKLREAVAVAPQPARYSVDEHGTMWVTDMEHGWDYAVDAVLALIDSPDGAP